MNIITNINEPSLRAIRKAMTTDRFLNFEIDILEFSLLCLLLREK